MAVSDKMIEEVFQAHLEAAAELLNEAREGIASGFAAFADASAFQYQPYEWQIASPPVIAYNPTYNTPFKPALPAVTAPPTLAAFPGALQNPNFQKPASSIAQKPSLQFPPVPGSAPSDPTGSPPPMTPLSFPSKPSLLPLPSTTLPYPYLTIPTAPDILQPVFDGTKPDPIHTISLDEYLQKLEETYNRYSQDIPNLVRAHWLAWFNAYIADRPLLVKLATTISSYMDTGGAGVPVPIEEAIVTRATDRVSAEQRRATLSVYDAAAKRGLLLPSGMLLAGLKEARQVNAEAVSKVATDVAVKNLELEHDHMKFMLQLGSQLEQWVAGFASDCAKVVLECNGQAIEMTKQVLTGMIEINNTIVKIYIAEWEAYKAAVEVYKARIEANEALIRMYEAQIKAELAKVEINKATVDMLRSIVDANKAIVEMYKTQVDAETAKVEADRVRVMAFEATVRAYAARVEAWRAQWAGYTARIEGETAKVKAYEAEVQAYRALVESYKAEIEAYGELVRGQAMQVQAIGTQNEQTIKAWGMVAEQNMKGYVAGMEGYRAEWGAIGEQLKGYAEGSRIIADSLWKGYEISYRIDAERAREHLTEWRASLEATLHAAQGLVQASNVSGQMASSALNGITTFAGALSTATSSGT